MPLVASQEAPGKGAPSLSDRVSDFLRRFDVCGMPAGARCALRAACHKLGARIPTCPAEDLAPLAAALLGRVSEDVMIQVVRDAHAAFLEDIPLIQVDKILRGTIASDMPADVRSCLRTLAGHADRETRAAWPDRETIAGETGVGLHRIDAILRDLVERGWLAKVPRYRPDGGRMPSTYIVQPERGRWWGAELKAKRHRETPAEKRDRRPPVSRGGIGGVSRRDLSPVPRRVA